MKLIFGSKKMKKDNPAFKIISELEDLQKALAVRSIVFIGEQKVPYDREIDGLDITSIHFLGTIENEPVATARIRVVEDCVKIERFAVIKEHRNKNIGSSLINFILEYIKQINCKKIILHAQIPSIKFYEKFGFTKQGNQFTDAGIKHYYMEKVK